MDFSSFFVQLPTCIDQSACAQVQLWVCLKSELAGPSQLCFKCRSPCFLMQVFFLDVFSVAGLRGKEYIVCDSSTGIFHLFAVSHLEWLHTVEPAPVLCFVLGSGGWAVLPSCGSSIFWKTSGGLGLAESVPGLAEMKHSWPGVLVNSPSSLRQFIINLKGHRTGQFASHFCSFPG